MVNSPCCPPLTLSIDLFSCNVEAWICPCASGLTSSWPEYGGNEAVCFGTSITTASIAEKNLGKVDRTYFAEVEPKGIKHSLLPQ